jgi:hypothetical protein
VPYGDNIGIEAKFNAKELLALNLEFDVAHKVFFGMCTEIEAVGAGFGWWTIKSIK